MDTEPRQFSNGWAVRCGGKRKPEDDVSVSELSTWMVGAAISCLIPGRMREERVFV